MDDPQRRPGPGDRSAVHDRIERALADGRIGSADAALRTANVDAARTMADLSLVAHDLDQVEATLGAGTTRSGVPASPARVPSPPKVRAPRESAGRLVPLLILGAVVALVVAGGVAFLVIRANSDSESRSGSSGQLLDPVAPGSWPSRTPGPSIAPHSPAAPGAPTSRLSAADIADFLAAYRRTFRTTRTLEMTFYPGNVVTSVPQPRGRHSGWSYRDGEFSDFGGTTRDAPGDTAFETRPLNGPALVANIARARRVLHVAGGVFTHAIVSYVTAFDPEPTVRIYVSNRYHEGGYYTTTLGGKYLRKVSY